MTKAAWMAGWVCIVVCSATSAWATTVLEKDFAALVHEADTIVVGTVTALENDAGSGRPVTLVTFTDLDVLKGTVAGDEFTVQVLGGTNAEGMTLRIAGVPEFTLGARMVVFVVGNETQAVPFVGLWQGVYRVVQNADQGDVMADHAGRPLTAFPQRQSADGLVYDEAPYTVQPQQKPALSLKTFLDAIEEEVQDEQ